MYRWHLHMQITCEQYSAVTCTENQKHRLSCKSFTWSWNKTIQHSCNKFHSITHSCHSRKTVQVHADHGDCCRWHVDNVHACRWCVDDVCIRRWCVDDIQMTYMSSTAKSPAESHSHVICMSSERDFTSEIFTVKQQSNNSYRLLLLQLPWGVTLWAPVQWGLINTFEQVSSYDH